MRSVNKGKNNQFKYTTLIKFMLKNKDNDLYYKGSGITSIKNLRSYWNYAHSHSTAYIPHFNKMYNIIQPKIKRFSALTRRKSKVINIKITRIFYININFRL